MMGVLDDHIRQLNNYNTIFGTFWFNVICVVCNLAQIVASVVLLGCYHSLLTLDYVWWPIIEILRLFVLTILRFDVMLKAAELYNDNRHGFKYTKRMIILLNLIGFFMMLIAAPIYLALLSTETNSSHDGRSQMYTVFLSVIPSFIVIRICLSLPLYCTLITGNNPLFNLSQEYQRIDDAITTRHRRRSRRRSQGAGSMQAGDNSEAQRLMARQWRMMEIDMLERRNMQQAVEESRRDAFRSTRKQQDEEYEKAVMQAKLQRQSSTQSDLKTEEEEHESGLAMEPARHQHNQHPFSSSNQVTSNDDDLDFEQGQEEDDERASLLGGDEYDVDADAMGLDALASEPEESDECVYVRVRLPNGVRCERRFHYTSHMSDVVLWTEHECVKHKLGHLVGNSQMVSTMPHTVYKRNDKDLQQLNFWRPNSKRRLVSPLLFVEEL